MRVVSLHPDVLVATSRIWQTTCTMVRSGEQTFVIDSPVLPDELDLLPAVLEQSKFASPIGVLATHADWDHLLGRLAFPRAPLGCAQTTVERLRSSPGAAQRELRAFDERYYVRRPLPLALGDVQPLAAPGICELGSQEIVLHPTEGHTADGAAYAIGWAGVLVVGDYLSMVEIPVLGKDGSIDAYLATLERLDGLLRGFEYIVPGHGGVLDPERALLVLEQDVAYLQSLKAGTDPTLPEQRRDRAQRELHEQNLAALG